MKIYLDFLKYIMENGCDKKDRTNTGTRSIFSYEMRIPLTSFPLLTTKKMHFKSIATELLWFLSGQTNIQYLHENKVTIWDEWADKDGNLGPIYGYQWRKWPGPKGNIDQISQLIKSLKENSDSRRHIVNAWNVGMLNEMALPPCHMMFQCYSQDNKLSLKIIQRSADAFLGVPFNLASYALLCHILAQLTDHQAHEIIWSGGDCHIYHNHFDAVEKQLSREPLKLPSLKLNEKITDIDKFTLKDIKIENYISHPKIEADIAV